MLRSLNFQCLNTQYMYMPYLTHSPLMTRITAKLNFTSNLKVDEKIVYKLAPELIYHQPKTLRYFIPENVFKIVVAFGKNAFRET